MDQTTLTYLISGILAFLPAIIWIIILFKNHTKLGLHIALFLGSTSTVIPIFIIQYIFSLFPQADINSFIQQSVTNPFFQNAVLYLWVGLTEEIAKQWLIRFVDNRYLLIQTINESIRFSLVAALGFAFAENIFYFYTIYTNLGIQTLIISILFRSIFTTIAHMVFSGIFGYYYGIAKFSINIYEQSKFTGKKLFFPQLIAKIFNISRLESFREQKILKGLFLAMIFHAAYNFMLHFNFIPGAAILAIGSFTYLMKLLKNRTGNLIMVSDTSTNQTSTMAKNDEQVVIELMGMWFNDKRYVDVIHICERLLKRDPDNKVVQLFKAKALDKMDHNSPYQIILSKLFPNRKKLEQKNILK